MTGIFMGLNPEDGGNGQQQSEKFLSCDDCQVKCILYLKGREINNGDCHVN